MDLEGGGHGALARTEPDFLNVNCGYVHLEQETNVGEGLEKEKLTILKRFCLIYLKSGYFTCCLMKHYMPRKVKQFMSDMIVGSVKEDRRTGNAEVSSKVHQKTT